MSSQKYYSSSRHGSLLPSHITSPGTNQSREQEHSDLQMYQRWKRKIPFQQPEGTWLQISELLRKIEHSGGPRGCIPAGILASPQLSAGREDLGAMPICRAQAGHEQGWLCFLMGSNTAGAGNVIPLTTHSPAVPHPMLKWRIHSPSRCCVRPAPPAPNTP